jgi:hypothetical protein
MSTADWSTPFMKRTQHAMWQKLTRVTTRLEPPATRQTTMPAVEYTWQPRGRFSSGGKRSSSFSRQTVKGTFKQKQKKNA